MPNDFPAIVIRASAGTGKTFQLTNRYLGLLQAGAKVDEILATTFTRKAAGEILDRVLERLADAALSPERAQELGKQLQDHSVDSNRCAALLAQVTQQLHRLRISTLDSLFAQMATSRALELGLPPGWSILDDLADARLRSQAIDTLLRSEDTQDVVRLLHLMTQGGVDRSVSRVLHDAVSDLYGLFLESEPAAWRHFPPPRMLTREQLEQCCRDIETDPELEVDGRMKTARDDDVLLARRSDWVTFVSKGLAAKVISGECKYYKKPISTAAIGNYERLIGHARGVLLNQLAQQTQATHDLLARFHALYERLKQQHGVLRFEDITRRLAADLQLKTTDIATYDFRMDSAALHVLLDEFQDTSLTQWQALKPFAERVTGTGTWRRTRPTRLGRSFFCVGDEKQAIYGWRGGRSEIFSVLENNLTDLTRETLAESFRSAQPVIDTVNELFLRLPDHGHLDQYQSAADSWCKAVPFHTTARKELAGYVRLESARTHEDAETLGNATLSFAADRISQIVRQCPGRSVGVLARKNDVVARLIYELRSRDVPASEEGGNPLTDSVAVQAVLSLLRLADHPGNTVARFHLVHSPLAAVVGLKTHDDDELAAQVASLVRRQLIEHGYGPTIDRWMAPIRNHLSAREFNRIEQLIDLAYAYESQATLRPVDFAALVEAQRIADPTVAAVRVMTVHQSKGLQFDIVVLADLDSGAVGQAPNYVTQQSDPTQPIERVCLYRNSAIQSLLPPDIQAMFAGVYARQITESLCVLYVAVTRAIHALHMIIAPSEGGSKYLPRTYAGFLRTAFTDRGPVEPEKILFEAGDSQWFAHTASAAQVVPPRAPRPKIQLQEISGRRRAGWERVTPSSLEGGTTLRIDQLLPVDNRQGLGRGTLFHAWFEQIRWLDDDLPSDELLQAIAAQKVATAVSVPRQIAEFRELLLLPELQRLLYRESYRADIQAWCQRQDGPTALDGPLEVATEFPFAVLHENRMLTGAIDRLVMIRQDNVLACADIIDFKTDAVTMDNRSMLLAATERYRPQQLAYRTAVSKLLRLPFGRIRTRLVFVQAGCIVEIA